MAEGDQGVPRDGEATALAGYREPTEFDLSEELYSVYECTECDNLTLTVSSSAAMQCHGEPMREVTTETVDVREPELRQVLLDAFGLPKLGIDICLCVIGEGPIPAGRVADLLDYDESTISRYLNDLVDLGLLEKSQLNREGGGYVHVYHSIDIEEMRRETLVGFYVWAGEAASLIESANVRKEAYLSGDQDAPLNDVFWETFDGE